MGKDTGYTEVQKRQINYTILEKLWEQIARTATSKSEKRLYDPKEKGRLYKALGTYNTDFSSYKTGKKTKLTKSMKAAIARVSYKYYKDRDSIGESIVSWESGLKNVLLGKKEIKIKDLSNDDILKLYGTDMDEEKRKEIIHNIEKKCERVVLVFWAEVKKESLLDAVCIWLSTVMAGEYSAYESEEKVKSAGGAFDGLSLEDLSRCDMMILKDNIKAVEKGLEKMKTVYNYRKLEKKSRKPK